MNNKRAFSSLLFGILFGLLIYQGVQAAVDLVEFTATPQESAILIEWETATEIDNAGFIVTRNTQPIPPFSSISGFIPAEGSGVIGAEYEFTDTDVTEGITYFYQLEIIDTSNHSDFSEIISAVIGAPDTATPSNTPTISNTPTASNTPAVSNTPEHTPTKTHTPDKSRTPTRTRRPSSTPRPSRTSTSRPPTRTPTAFTDTPTVTPSPTITPSPTLFAPPDIVLTFPATDTPVPSLTFTVTPEPSATPTPKPESIFQRVVNSSAPLILGVICLIILVWAAIAVGVFIFIQQRNA